MNIRQFIKPATHKKRVQKLAVLSAQASSPAIFAGVVNSAFLPSRSFSATPRARAQRVQTWMRMPCETVPARTSLKGGQPNGIRLSATV